MDVLGFKKMIKQSSKDDGAKALFDRFHGAISAALQRLNEYWRETGEPRWQVKPFTDNVVLGCPVGALEEGEAELNRLIPAVGAYQLDMALAGFFVRGGISYGDLFIDDHMVYGPALLEAYELESSIAKVPRTILSQGIRETMTEFAKGYPDPPAYPLWQHILTGSDGYAYVNYLKQLPDEEAAGAGGMATHREEIEKCLREKVDDLDVWAKYVWLANYHDQFCLQHRADKGRGECIGLSARQFTHPPAQLTWPESANNK
ncbi:MAG TPA: hypothetical protein VMU04_08245 [Candidatus Acidoferrum sp.]|nr:hypothetical protein [Candidatus Acidoferrum sp.]